MVCVAVCGGLKNASLWQLASVSVGKPTDSVVLGDFSMMLKHLISYYRYAQYSIVDEVWFLLPLQLPFPQFTL